ncbi:hypothetical protein EPR50_G00001540 [Perca flavescens]|uniref:Uncharacterized protein n=1 Tax=Perca flavescens TaxID=8167 RepID=A0A484DNE5_PERFV|nr:hypothetical protein EPR50_G00001540 [Perca flavescens]
MRPSPVNICHRISENFTSILPNMLKLVKDSPLKKLYMEAREDALAEDIKGIDFRGGLLLLPSIFKEKIEDFIILGQNYPQTPYPTVQLKAQGLKYALSRQCQSVVFLQHGISWILEKDTDLSPEAHRKHHGGWRQISAGNCNSNCQPSSLIMPGMQ